VFQLDKQYMAGCGTSKGCEWVKTLAGSESGGEF
jgi:hypothetical protein